MRPLPVLQWRRIGECNRCGECCRSGDPFAGTEGRPAIAGACPKLARDGEVYACTDRSAANTYYTNGCALWPSHPKHTAPYPSCSYRFEAVT